MNPLYLLSSDMSFKTFQLLHERLVKDSGPTPEHGDRIIWEMMRDKKILCWFEEIGDMGIGLELPKGRKIFVIK